MKVFVKVKSRSRQECVEKIGKNHFVVSVKEPPINGLANKGVIRALSNYFEVARTNVYIISGFTSRNKLIEIKQ